MYGSSEIEIAGGKPIYILLKNDWNLILSVYDLEKTIFIFLWQETLRIVSTINFQFRS